VNAQPIVVVAGGAGYVGSVLVPRLLESGYRVRVLDSLVFGLRGLEPVLDRIEVVEEDIRSVPGSVLRGADALVNLAALSNDPTANFRPQLCWDVNAEGALRLAKLCIDEGISRYVYASSSSIYDTRDPSTAPEACREEDPIRPIGPYSSSKYEAETRILPLASERFAPVALRKGTLYGFSPRMRFDLVVNTFVRGAMRDGTISLHNGGGMWRPLLSVEDAAAAYIRCLEAPAEAIRGEAFNVVHCNESIANVAAELRAACEALGRALCVESTPSPSPVRNYCASERKAQRVLGLESAITIRESVDKMLHVLPEAGFTDFDNPWYSNIAWMERTDEEAPPS